MIEQPVPLELSNEERWRRAIALARMLEGIPVSDAENVMKRAMELVRRGSLVTTTSQHFVILEEYFLFSNE